MMRKFWKVLEMDGGDDYKTLSMYEQYTLKMVKFVTHILLQ